MKVTFLGVGAAFSKTNASSNLLIESGSLKILIDCGPFTSRSLVEYGLSIKDITHIVITHLHADHIGGLEEFAFMSRLVFKTRIRMLSTQTLLESLWDHCLRGGLEFIELSPGDTTPQKLSDFFEPVVLPIGQWNSLAPEEPLQFYTRYSDHVNGMECYSVEVREASDNPGLHFFFSGDTRLALSTLEEVESVCSCIFHDCQLFNAGTNNHLAVHVSYDQLLKIPASIRHKMWLYHYGDEKLPDAKADGFLGFVSHHQSFIFE